MEEDTRPHDIYPRRAKALHWTTTSTVGGSWVELAVLAVRRQLIARRLMPVGSVLGEGAQTFGYDTSIVRMNLWRIE